MISKEEVCRIAKLARLELSEKEIEKMQRDLSEILDYFDLLKSAPAPLKQNFGETNKASMFRSDEILPRDAGLAEKIITASPDKKDGYIKVKAIF